MTKSVGDVSHLKQKLSDLTGVVPWAERHPANGKVASSIPSQGTTWVVGQVPGWGLARSNRCISFTHGCFFLLSPLSKNK